MTQGLEPVPGGVGEDRVAWAGPAGLPLSKGWPFGDELTGQFWGGEGRSQKVSQRRDVGRGRKEQSSFYDTSERLSLWTWTLFPPAFLSPPPHSLSLSKNLYYDWFLSSLSHPENLNPKGNPSLCQLFLVTKLHTNTTLEQRGFFFFFFFKSLQLLQGVEGVRKEVFLQMACGDF